MPDSDPPLDRLRAFRAAQAGGVVDAASGLTTDDLDQLIARAADEPGSVAAVAAALRTVEHQDPGPPAGA